MNPHPMFKCLNPECSETFHRGQRGGVLIFNQPNGSAAQQERYFWLCEQCYATYEFLTRERQGRERSRTEGALRAA